MNAADDTREFGYAPEKPHSASASTRLEVCRFRYM